MKIKLLIIGMLLLSLVVLSGCKTEERIEVEKCLEEVAEEFCEERDCEFKSLNDDTFSYPAPGFWAFTGEWRKTEYIRFTDKEIKSCEVKTNENNK